MRRLLGITAAFVFLCAFSAHAATVQVITKKNSLRGDCTFFSRVAASVKEGDALEVVSREGDWLWVKFGGRKGCIHKSAVEERKVSLGGLLGVFAPGGATEDEVTLAGKGFNPQVEGSYKRKNPELRFSLVDRVEGYGVSDAMLKGFITKGGLRAP
jgi:hypothetical protein